MLNSGGVIFVRGHSPLSSLIKAFDGEYSHVALLLSPNRILEIDKFQTSRIVPLRYNDFDIVSIPMSADDISFLHKMSIQLVEEYKYDYTKFVGYGIERLFHYYQPNFMDDPKRLLCSELVCLVLFCLGKIPYEDYVLDKTPNELYEFLITLYPASE